jgi:hypothetical protein
MDAGTKNNLKNGAKISLVVLLLSVVGQFITIYQTKYQLTSPLIPESIIATIIKPNIFIGFVSTIVSLAGLLLYFYERYLFIIILVGLIIIWQQFYPYWSAS